MRRKLMAILVVVLIAYILFLVSLRFQHGPYRYTVSSNTAIYYTNEVTKDGNCIKFVTATTHEQMSLCGSYSIKENKRWKKK